MNFQKGWLRRMSENSNQLLSSAALFTVEGLYVIKLSNEAAPALQRFLERCGDYYEMVEGRPPEPDAALDELNSGPPDRVPHDLFCFGLSDDRGEIVGIISVFRHHPRQNQWYLSFFMLDPAWRGLQLGKAAYFAFENWVINQGGEVILLAVVEPNVRAARFWESLGFEFPRCFPKTAIGLRQHILIEYEKTL
jgi:RimJ/RimL family protein N-acetyltransferase